MDADKTHTIGSERINPHHQAHQKLRFVLYRVSRLLGIAARTGKWSSVQPMMPRLYQVCISRAGVYVDILGRFQSQRV